jgi:hypothetical protein
MKLSEAIEINGKACREGWDKDFYVESSFGYLINHEGKMYSHTCIFEDDWHPYHEVKEIVPKKGEVWQFNCNIYPHFITTKIGVRLYLTWVDGVSIPVEESVHPVIHGQNGWKRIFPKVEDANVERVEIEPALIDLGRTMDDPNTYSFKLPDGYYEKLKKRPLILEIPKEAL